MEDFLNFFFKPKTFLIYELQPSMSRNFIRDKKPDPLDGVSGKKEFIHLK